MPAVNKVVYGGRTLIDLTADTVTPETLMAGRTCHASDGSVITGTLFAGLPGTCDVYESLRDSDGDEITDGAGGVVEGKTVYKRL